jgi:hypothetical protein
VINEREFEEAEQRWDEICPTLAEMDVDAVAICRVLGIDGEAFRRRLRDRMRVEDSPIGPGRNARHRASIYFLDGFLLGVLVARTEAANAGEGNP